MHVSEFDFELPERLIAQRPLPERHASRLLVVHPEHSQLHDQSFRNFPTLLESGDLLVLNDTRVLPARFFARKRSGGKLECMLERVLDERRALVQIRGSKALRAGGKIVLESGHARVEQRDGPFFTLEFVGPDSVTDYLQQHGHTPLPPYIRRPDQAEDKDRYQTIYARRPGAVAAPTAGLHFDTNIMERLEKKGVRVAFVTLHVGAGTFQPVRVDDIETHAMHPEHITLAKSLCEQVARTRATGGRIVAGGTTVVRALESAASSGALAPFSGDTRLFLYPGKKFRVVDALLTNFHLPRSSLLMLVAAFVGHDRLMAAYAHAIAAGYRFYSYGDAMFVPTPANGVRDAV